MKCERQALWAKWAGARVSRRVLGSSTAVALACNRLEYADPARGEVASTAAGLEALPNQVTFTLRTSR